MAPRSASMRCRTERSRSSHVSSSDLIRLPLRNAIRRKVRFSTREIELSIFLSINRPFESWPKVGRYRKRRAEKREVTPGQCVIDENPPAMLASHLSYRSTTVTRPQSVLETYQSNCRKASLHPRPSLYPLIERAWQFDVLELRDQSYGIGAIYPVLQCFTVYSNLRKLDVARCGLSESYCASSPRENWVSAAVSRATLFLGCVLSSRTYHFPL
jgi:hypothetical protein